MLMPFSFSSQDAVRRDISLTDHTSLGLHNAIMIVSYRNREDERRQALRPIVESPGNIANPTAVLDLM